MSSEKDLLDELLNGISTEDEQAGQEMDSLDIDDVAGMSEAEITKRLEEGMENVSGRSTDSFQGDVLDMLGDTGDSDLQDIQDMLKKSDRNETIDRGFTDLDADEEADPAAMLRADIEEAGEKKVAGSSKEERALEKKRQKEEKAAKRKAAKEAAKAAKEAKRNQKKARKNKEVESDSFQESESNEIKAFDMSRDLDILDSIVSGAGRVERRGRTQGDSGISEKPMKTDRADSGPDFRQNDFNLDESEGMDSTNLDVVALDMDEADAYIPDISVSTRTGEGQDEKKKGLFSKLVNILTEEEEEPENENIRLSKENEGILQDLDNEEAQKKSGAKKKPKKAKKAAKKKDAKPKKVKPAKPKKAKKPKETEPYIPGSRLTIKKMLPVLLLGITVGAVVFLFVNFAADYSVKQAAAAAFNKGDYKTCYVNLYGRELNETEAMMYGKSESILYVQLMRKEYELTAANGTAVEALDRLLQIVDRYPALYRHASQWNASEEVQAVYNELLGILYENYGITEAQAQEVYAIKSDIEYTRAVTALAEGRVYGSWNSSVLPKTPGAGMESGVPEGIPSDGQQDGESGELGDELPEEEELGYGNFVDNQ